MIGPTPVTRSWPSDRRRPIVVLTLDDQPLVGAALSLLLKSEPDIELCGAAPSRRAREGVTRTITAQRSLAARGESPAAFGRRCIPADGVAPPSNIPDILGRRALSAGRLVALGATPDFHHGLLGRRQRGRPG
jgi:hypothetical protein